MVSGSSAIIDIGPRARRELTRLKWYKQVLELGPRYSQPVVKVITEQPFLSTWGQHLVNANGLNVLPSWQRVFSHLSLDHSENRSRRRRLYFISAPLMPRLKLFGFFCVCVSVDYRPHDFQPLMQPSGALIS